MNPFFEGKIRKRKRYTSENSPRLGGLNIRF